MKLRYKGFTAEITVDDEGECLQFAGEVLDTRVPVTFSATRLRELLAAFHAAVDGYIASEAARGEPPR